MSMRILALVLGLLLAGCTSAPEEEASPELGKEVFNDPGLGTTGASCNSCHPGGGTVGGEARGMPIPDLHGAAETFPKYKKWADRELTLAEMNNACIEMMMKGEPLDTGSKEMKALIAYEKTL